VWCQYGCVTDDSSLCLNIHMSAATSGTITIDHETKSILQNFTHEPDAVKGVAIPEDLAAPLASLALHRIDLIRAVRFLGEIGQQGGRVARRAGQHRVSCVVVRGSGVNHEVFPTQSISR